MPLMTLYTTHIDRDGLTVWRSQTVNANTPREALAQVEAREGRHFLTATLTYNNTTVYHHTAER